MLDYFVIYIWNLDVEFDISAHCSSWIKIGLLKRAIKNNQKVVMVMVEWVGQHSKR